MILGIRVTTSCSEFRCGAFSSPRPMTVGNAGSFYRLPIRCVGCSATFLIVSAACGYDGTALLRSSNLQTILRPSVRASGGSNGLALADQIVSTLPSCRRTSRFSNNSFSFERFTATADLIRPAASDPYKPVRPPLSSHLSVRLVPPAIDSNGNRMTRPGAGGRVSTATLRSGSSSVIRTLGYLSSAPDGRLYRHR